MKKYSWILTLLLAFTMAFVLICCGENSSDDGDEGVDLTAGIGNLTVTGDGGVSDGGSAPAFPVIFENGMWCTEIGGVTWEKDGSADTVIAEVNAGGISLDKKGKMNFTFEETVDLEGISKVIVEFDKNKTNFNGYTQFFINFSDPWDGAISFDNDAITIDDNKFTCVFKDSSWNSWHVNLQDSNDSTKAKKGVLNKGFTIFVNDKPISLTRFYFE